MKIRKWIAIGVIIPSLQFAFVSGAVAQPISPAITWTVFDENGCNPVFRRSVIEDSVQAINNNIAYIIKLEMLYPAGSVTTIERGVVTDCAKRRRFEVVSQFDWESNPFSSVYANTASGKELDLVCNLPLGFNSKFDVRNFPIPHPMAPNGFN